MCCCVGSMRSALLNAMMSCLSSDCGMMRCESSSICCVGVVLSMSQMAISHCCSLLNVRSIPIDSMVSLVSRMPAVSMNRNSVPPSVMVSSMTSRVVPCMLLTSARSSCTRRLRSVDFPAFVSPTMATGMPFLMAFPTANDCVRRCISCFISCVRLLRRVRSANCTSSSLKSSSSSMSETNSSSCSRSCASRWLNCPRIWFIARRCAAADVAAMRSATASACDRSMRPDANARRVYSPGSASRHPADSSSVMMRCCMYCEPWQAISMVSCPVNECGARNVVHTTSSMISSLLYMWPYSVVLAGCVVSVLLRLRAANMVSHSCMALLPLTRITAIPPLPAGVAMAQIVSLTWFVIVAII